MRTAVIGVGNMGSTYAAMIRDGMIDGMELSAITRPAKGKEELFRASIEHGLPVYDRASDLFDAVEKGKTELDAVVISTPHYSHQEIAERAFRDGLDVLCDKPSGVFSRQSRIMEAAADKSGAVYGMIFNQRTLPLYRKLHDLVNQGKYGAVKRVNWVITDWYRPDLYYSSSSWRAGWAGNGGGVILNQCPHNLDLLQWVCGMPSRVQGFCHEGHFHDIEVEDDVTVYLEWENGATGTFVTSTGDAPGINRLEISLDEALIVCENGTLRICELLPELGCREKEYRSRSTDFFRHIHGTWKEIPLKNAEDTYRLILQNFADACSGRAPILVPGSEGRKSLLIGNAIYLSSWEHRMVELPEEGSADEEDFERIFEEHLSKKM